MKGAAARWWVVLAALLALFVYLYMGRSEPASGGLGSRFEGSTMGTSYSVLLGEPQTVEARQTLQREVEALLGEVNASMSTYDPNSELSRFNRHASTEPFPVSAPLADVVRMASEVSRASEGAFDVTVGALVDAWGFGPSGRPDRLLDDDDLAALRTQVGHAHLRLEDGKLSKTNPQLQVDLSGIAKGYAVDRIAEWLEQRGHCNYLVEIGGELRAAGRNAQGLPFRVGIEVPAGGRRAVYTAVALEGGAMATSGNYRNHFELEGERQAHTLDPTTGRPVRHHLLSATVLHPTCAIADAWATALMAAGPDQAWRLAQAHDLDVLLLVAGEGGVLEERVTPGFSAHRIQPGTRETAH